MGYNQNRKAALNTLKPLRVRYLSLLRCVSCICILKRFPFKKVLILINPALGIPWNKDDLHEIINKSIVELDSRRWEAISENNGLVFYESECGVTETTSHLLSLNQESSNGNRIYKYFSQLASITCNVFRSDKSQVIQSANNPIQSKKLLYKDYLLMTPIIESRSKELYSFLNTKLKHAENNLAFPLQQRIKTWDSISEKIDRVKLQISSVTEMQDLIGLRIVTVFERDISKIIRIIERNFSIVRSYNTNKNKSVDNNYTSIHVIIDSSKCNFIYSKSKTNIKILSEIQVMTLAQFTYAKASHFLHYKKNTPLAENSIRALQRTSALLETVDLEFERILADNV